MWLLYEKKGNNHVTSWYLLKGDVETTGVQGSRLGVVYGKRKLCGARGAAASWGIWRQELPVAVAAMPEADISWLAGGNDRLAMACRQVENGRGMAADGVV